MRELTKDEIVRKWGPVVEASGIQADHVEKISLYLHHHAMLENENMFRAPSPSPRLADTAPSNNPFPALLPISIEVLKKIKDLSKVRFVAVPEWEENGEIKKVETIKMTASIPRQDAFDLTRRYGINVVIETEKLGVKLMSDHINKLIDEGKQISFYVVISSVQIISEGTGEPKIGFVSRFLAEDKPITMNDI